MIPHKVFIEIAFQEQKKTKTLVRCPSLFSECNYDENFELYNIYAADFNKYNMVLVVNKTSTPDIIKMINYEQF